jgi:hypothetical protein
VRRQAPLLEIDPLRAPADRHPVVGVFETNCVPALVSNRDAEPDFCRPFPEAGMMVAGSFRFSVFG